MKEFTLEVTKQVWTMQAETCPGSDMFEGRCSFSNFSSSKPYELHKTMKGCNRAADWSQNPVSQKR
jgi:hypothetical protein